MPFLLGICSAYFWQTEDLFRWSAVTLSFCILLLLAIQISYKKLKLWRKKRTIALLYFFSFFVLGIFLCLLKTDFLQPNYYAKTDYPQLKIWVNDEPQLKNQILRFEAKVTEGFKNGNSEKVQGKMLVALKVDSLHPIQLNYGDELIVAGNYHEVEPPYNPYEFDFQKWLAAKNIYQQCFIRQDQLRITHQNRGNPILRYAIKLRQEQVAVYRKLIKNDEAFAVASTLILGYRADLQKETLMAYSKTGTIHALSVSGMHVGIIYIMLNGLLFFLNRRKATILIKVCLIIVLIWAYSLLTGFSPSVLRSAIMLSIFIIAKQFKRNSNNYNILAASALFLLCYNPFLIWDVGFQLSYISVFGLIYFQPKIYAWLYVKNKYLDQLWNVVALSLAAQLATMPLSIYYFHQFPVYFILSNLFILIPITLMMYIGIAILLIKFYFLAPLFEWIITLTNQGLKWIANLPLSSLSSIFITNWQLLLFTLVIVCLSIAFVNYQKRLLWVGLSFLLVFQLSVTWNKMSHFLQREIVFFSLRKNYAAAFIDGKTAILLTDLTSENKNFDFFVRPALEQKQIEQIKFITWDSSYQGHNFRLEKGQTVFYKHRMLLVDSTYNRSNISSRPKFAAIWLHRNAKYYPKYLQRDIQFNRLLVDATNSDYYIKKTLAQADSLNLRTQAMKRNRSLTLKID
jgi:competence protein ComEC